jgi:hypothetical protein
MEPTVSPDTAFLQLIKSPVKFRLFLMKKLPAALFSGLNIESINEQSCTVSVPYKWFTQNPFRSTYFACLSMAAEMSTGALVLAQVYQRVPAISTLIVAVDSVYHSKAVNKTFFTCVDGLLIKKVVEEAARSNAPQTVKTYAKGVNANGDLIAEFWFTWSIKAKIKKG